MPSTGFRLSRALGLAVAPLLVPARAAVGQIAFGDLTLDLQPVATGLVAPVQAKPPPDGSGRLFIVDQAGLVRVMQDGALLATPFLDVRPLMVVPNAGYDERGLLGLAFHPDYAHNGRFFVHYTAPRDGNPGDPCVGTSRGCSSEVLAEYRVSATDPNVADPLSAVVLLSVPKPQFNHAGGALDFGPDGYLYMSLGDGGGANDGLADNPPSHGPIGNAQNLNVYLGKILRFDVSTPGALNIPPSNPFVGLPDHQPAVYAYGLRNPYAFSFDDGPGGTGRLICGDVGQNVVEEIDFIEPGGNYGWPIKEGTACFDPFNPNTPPASCPAGDATLPPVVDYRHVISNQPIGLAVVGGYVYRGSVQAALRGLYLFGDFSTSFAAADGHLFYLDPSDASPQILRPRLGADNHALARFVKGFGRDADGELYVLASTLLGPTGATGVVYKVVVMCDADFNADGNADQDDVAYLINVIAGGSNPTGRDPDFNRDGTADQDDTVALINAVAGGGCQ
jgi:glucose/arabinose dehydrogenase